ncbi:MAG: protein kinase [Sandaracinaceae bacterium]
MSSQISDADLVLGRYRIVKRLASGGMGVVYLARIEGAKGFARPAVIKRMLPSLTHDEELVGLFVREAQILSNLRHPGIVGVLDFESERDSYLMALEYVHGYHVGHWLRFHREREEPFDAELALFVMVQVLEALDYVHHLTDAEGQHRGIVHRDISPSNILIDVEGHVRLLDFGVARMMGDATSVKEGEVSLKGKFPYLAPELLNQGEPSPASDIYACGVVLHELLVGQNEFKRPDATETLRRVLLHQLSSVEEVRHDVPRGLDRILRIATAREPKNRYERGSEFAAELRTLLRASDTDLRAKLKAGARRDFLGDLPILLKLEPLDDLERAWRNPKSARDLSWPPVRQPRGSSPGAEGASELPTETSYEGPAAGGGGGVPWFTLLFGLLAVAGLGVGITALAVSRAARDAAPAPVVIVQQQRVDEPAAAEAAPRDDRADAPSREEAATQDEQGPPPQEESRPERSRRERSRRGPDRAALLTRTFNRQQGAIRSCFEANPLLGAGERPRVSIRFTVGSDGHVQAAELSPPEVARSSVGSCLLRVARATEFGPQPEAVAFRIPITVRSR